MTPTGTKLTLQEYLTYDDGTDIRYELVNGVLTAMPAESPENVEIASFLFAMLLQVCPYYLLHRGTEILVSSEEATTRYPDLLVLTEAGRAALAGKPRSLITLEMPPPTLVVEVVSPGEPGEPNYDRDYIAKPQEYAQRQIPEYWIIDPNRAVVLVLTLGGSAYQAAEFRGADRIQSNQFPQLNLTAQQILGAGQAE